MDGQRVARRDLGSARTSNVLFGTNRSWRAVNSAYKLVEQPIELCDVLKCCCTQKKRKASLKVRIYVQKCYSGPALLSFLGGESTCREDKAELISSGSGMSSTGGRGLEGLEVGGGARMCFFGS